jgi:hypothetical protein
MMQIVNSRSVSVKTIDAPLTMTEGCFYLGAFYRDYKISIFVRFCFLADSEVGVNSI